MLAPLHCVPKNGPNKTSKKKREIPTLKSKMTVSVETDFDLRIYMNLLVISFRVIHILRDVNSYYPNCSCFLQTFEKGQGAFNFDLKIDGFEPQSAIKKGYQRASL